MNCPRKETLVMSNTIIILAKVEDSQHKTAAQKAKDIAIPLLGSKPAFTHVSFEAMPKIGLEQAIKSQLRLNPAALVQQKIYNPLQAEFRGYSELVIAGFTIRYVMRTSAFCHYAIVSKPNHISDIFEGELKSAV